MFIFFQINRVGSYKDLDVYKEGAAMDETKGLAEIEVKVGLSAREIISAIKQLSEEDREFLIENLLAATSPDYLESIKEARENYREGRVVPHAELFKE